MRLLDNATDGSHPVARRWPNRSPGGGWLAIILLAASLVLVATATFLAPDGYSWIRHTVSESMAQGVPGAWLGRSGVLIAALGVLVLIRSATGWPSMARTALQLYAVSLMAAALFPEQPWDETVAFDRLSAIMHTTAAFGAGFWFVAAVVSLTLDRANQKARTYDLVVLAAMASIPMLMLAFEIPGLLQRGLILAGYGWLIAESLRVSVQPSMAIWARMSSARSSRPPAILMRLRLSPSRTMKKGTELTP